MSQHILLLENIHPVAQQILTGAGLDVQREAGALVGPDLLRRARGHDLLGIRSKTELRGEFFSAVPDLLAVGAFCIGTNQVDLETAQRAGVVVFNAPYSNTRSVAELVLGEIIMLSRQVMERSVAAHRGEWMKSADGSREVRGKTLGIIGYGHIGSQLSILAEALGMRVIYFDLVKKLPLGNSQPAESLDHLLATSDFITLHVPETPETTNMLGAAQLAKAKRGACVINASRGTVVDLEALAQALSDGRLAGAAIDVFPEEPANNREKFRSCLQGLANVILTPHIGGSTEEAQENIGAEVAQSFLQFLAYGTTLGAVNFPQLAPPQKIVGRRILNVHRNVPGVLSQINQVVSGSGGNVALQMLATEGHIGYVILDVEGGAPNLAASIQALPQSLKTRTIPSSHGP